MIRLVQNIGNIFKERGGALKIGVITFIFLLYVVSLNYNGGCVGENPDGSVFFNLPQFLLFAITGFISSGLIIEIIRNRMNGGEKLLPDIDLWESFISGIRIIPFSSVWGTYIFIFILLAILACLALGSINKLLMIAAIVLFVICIIVLILGFSTLYYLHVAKFSYRHVLNPLYAFQIIPFVALPAIGLVLAWLLLLLIIGGVFFIIISLGFFAPISDGGFGVVSIIAMAVMVYVYLTLSIAFCIRYSDMVQEKLEGTFFLTDGYTHNLAGFEDEN